MSKQHLTLALFLIILCVFPIIECQPFSDLNLDSHFKNIEIRLKNVPNVTQKLSNSSWVVRNEVGIEPLINLQNVFCVLLFFANITDMCRRQMDITCRNPGMLGTMVDAWSKVPYTGMQVATRYDFGTYDECINIDYEQGGLRILGKQCIGGLIVPTTTNITEENILSSVVALSYCVPDRCTGDDVFNMLAVLPVRELVNDFMCTTKITNTTLEGNAIPVMLIFVVIITIAVISTILDISLQMNNIKVPFPLLTAFSLYSNSIKLFQTSPVSSGNKEQILCFHGLKVISMMWITAGHYAVAWQALPVVNDAEVKGFLDQRYAQYIGTAHLAVDTFFFISGFLLAYQYFKKQGSRSIGTQVKSLPMLILQRYLRLTPSILMLYLFIIGLGRYLASGPLQLAEVSLRNNCIERWWSVFLYIENYYDWRNMCLVNLWYVSADMQLFLVAPLIMIPIAWQLKKSFRAALVELIFFCILCTGLPLFTKLWSPQYDPDYDEFDAHSRLVDYFIGFTFGFVIRHKRNKPFLFSNFVSILLWCLTISAMLSTVMVLHEINMHYGYEAKAFTYTFMRPVWCLSLCWIVYASIHGKGGGISWVLSNGLMQCGGKLTFAMYLIHGIIIYQWALATRTKRYFSDLEMFYVSTGIFVVTWVLSVFWALLFESPVIIIMKCMFEGGGGERRPAQQIKPNNLVESPDMSKKINDDKTTLENILDNSDTKHLKESNI